MSCAFSYAAAVPVLTPGYVSLRQDIHVLKHYLQKHFGIGKIGTLHVDIGDARILIEGHEPFIPWYVAEEVDHAIRAFAERHATSPFAYKTEWDGEAREESLGVHRTSTPLSRGESAPSFEDVLLETTFDELDDDLHCNFETAPGRSEHSGAAAAFDGQKLFRVH